MPCKPGYYEEYGYCLNEKNPNNDSYPIGENQNDQSGSNRAGGGGWFDKVLDFIEVGTKGASDIISAKNGNPYQTGTGTRYPTGYYPPTQSSALPTWAIVMLVLFGGGFLFLFLKNKK
jgi:hypothetical protein